MNFFIFITYTVVVVVSAFGLNLGLRRLARKCTTNPHKCNFLALLFFIIISFLIGWMVVLILSNDIFNVARYDDGDVIELTTAYIITVGLVIAIVTFAVSEANLLLKRRKL